ncbi:MAG: PAS domain S-box protein [Cyclobacteriaceae bacterium]
MAIDALLKVNKSTNRQVAINGKLKPDPSPELEVVTLKEKIRQIKKAGLFYKKKFLEAEKGLANMTKNLPGAVYQWTLDGKQNHVYNYISDGSEELFEIPAYEFMTDFNILSTMILAEEMHGLNASYKDIVEGRISHGEDIFRVKTESGKIKWIKSKFSVGYDDEGKMIVSGFYSDETANYTFQQRLKKSEEKMRELAEHQAAEADKLYHAEQRLKNITTNLPVVSFQWTIDEDLQTNFDYISDQSQELFGLTSSDITTDSDTLWELIVAEDVALLKAHLQKMLSGAQSLNATFRINTAAGIKFVSARSDHKNTDGNQVTIVGYFEDITEKMHISDELEMLSLVASKTDNAVIITDANGRIQWVNQGFVDISGYDPEEVIDKKPGTFLQGKDTDPQHIAGIREGLSSGESFSQEILNYKKDGTSYWLRLAITPVKDAAGNTERFIAIETDITKDKLTQEQIRRSEEQMRKLAEKQLEETEKLYLAEKMIQNITRDLPVVAFQWTYLAGGDQKFDYIGEQCATIFSAVCHEIQEDPAIIWENIPEQDADRLKEQIFVAIEKQSNMTASFRISYDGKLKTVKMYCNVATKDDQKNVLIGYFEDITDQVVRSEEIERLSLVASQTDNAVIITDEKGLIEWVNDSFTKITGYTTSEVLGKKPGHILQGKDTDENDRQAIRDGLASGKSFTTEILNYNKDGQPYWLELRITPVLDDAGNVNRFIAIESDISERRKTEERIVKSEKRMREIAEEQLEVSEKLMMAEKKLKKALAEEKVSRKELEKAQAQLVNKEKLASLGQLTAGIAHEINNPINFIYNGVEAMNYLLELIKDFSCELEKVDGENEKVELLQDFESEGSLSEVCNDLYSLGQDVKQGVERTINIVKGLRTFSRLDESDQKLADINENLDATIMLLTSKVEEKKITIEKYYDESIGQVKHFPVLLNQVFMNIIDNAIAAIPSDDGVGKIMIYTENNGDEVQIRIKDNGSGMPDEVKKKIFDPFYTTKEVGSGTGLGLAISYGIIDKHDGKISVNSEEGEGTEFIIAIPNS